MSKTLLIGATSAIAKALQEYSDREFINFSRSEGTLDLNGDLGEIANLADINGLVYFPGTINLKPFAMLKEDDFVNDFNVNVLGAVKVLKKVINQLKEADGASVVFISSVAANLGLPYHVSIAAAKSALEGMSKALAAEYAAAKVCFNVVAPSLTNTPLAGNLLKTERQIEANEKESYETNRLTRTSGKTIDFLLDAHRNWVTGQVFAVDGGMSNLK